MRHYLVCNVAKYASLLLLLKKLFDLYKLCPNALILTILKTHLVHTYGLNAS